MKKRKAKKRRERRSKMKINKKYRVFRKRMEQKDGSGQIAKKM